ncbi:hypothetical protein [Kitasatospora terrestris]|uniref:Superoxide dismutase n=1 Tax=Kitasatospora terrestris TaxID=258051 RepID=A0ABP9ES96_9ACTN
MPLSRRTLLSAAAAGLLPVAAAGRASARPRLPETYVVSDEPGILPEGIAIGPDGTMVVGSDGTGRLFRGHVDRPRLRPFPAAGIPERASTLGVRLDPAGRVVSVGGAVLSVHGRDGALISRATAPDGPLGPPRLNDLAVTPGAVYVTDWANPSVLRAELRAGLLGPLEPWLDFRPALPGFPAQYWLLNGIVADPAGRTLLVASNGTEALWRVDTATRRIDAVDLGEPSFGPDGMVLSGRTLYAVLNYGAPTGVYVARLDDALRTGRVVHRITDAPLVSPTTLARHGGRLYVVNSQLDSRPGTPPYTVTALPDPACAER